MRSYKLLLVMAVLVLTLIAGCGQQEPIDVENEKIIPVEVLEAIEGEIDISNAYLGTIYPKQTVNIIPKMNGKIARVYVQDGDQVEAGDVLVQLDTSDISGQVDQAEVSYQLALLQLEKLKVGTRIEQLEQSRAAFSMSQAQYESAKVAFERTEQLYQAGAIPKQQLEQAETQYKVATAQLKQAEESLKMAEVGATPEDIRLAELQVAQAEVTLRNARNQLDNAVITAPISGVVSAVSAKVGEMASPSMAVVVINQLDKVEIQINLTEKDINKVEKGQQAKVLVSAVSKQPFEGKITNISPVADPRTRTFLMKVEVANEAGQLKGGMSASVDITTERQGGEIVVPMQAVLEQNGEKIVYVIVDGKAEKRIVKLGMNNEAEIIVTEGLQVGEKVVVKGQHYLEEGSKVTVVGGEVAIDEAS
ncbi:MAG: efflux RND transporter periplasmic adaptor subunit [Bacillota bacterium]|nr:efflux RND transporter periplasmic adaptor subunit [Bacillota bacterium]